MRYVILALLIAILLLTNQSISFYMELNAVPVLLASILLFSLFGLIVILNSAKNNNKTFYKQLKLSKRLFRNILLSILTVEIFFCVGLLISETIAYILLLANFILSTSVMFQMQKKENLILNSIRTTKFYKSLKKNKKDKFELKVIKHISILEYFFNETSNKTLEYKEISIATFNKLYK